MPARQPFDERHLQDVVLAQSGQIRASGRFSGLEIITRPVVVIAAFVAIVAIALGVKDYFERENANSVAGPDTSAVEPAKATTHLKKSTSGKTDRTRMSASGRTAAASAVANEIEKPLISGQYGDDGAKATMGMENRETLAAQAGREEQEAAIDRDHGMPKDEVPNHEVPNHGAPNHGALNQRDTVARPGSSTCLPLPNGTQPEDVDAPYYFGWATEYCGRDLTPTAPLKVTESQPSKR